MDAVSEENRYDYVLRILRGWGLSAESSAQILKDKEKLLAVLSMHESLEFIFSEDPERSFQWPQKPNQAFGGQSVVDIVLSGDMERIEDVRKYLKYHVYNA